MIIVITIFQMYLFFCCRYFDAGDSLPIPTHVYVILIKCKVVGKKLPCDGDVDILSFILPNLKEAPNCLVTINTFIFLNLCFNIGITITILE